MGGGRLIRPQLASRGRASVEDGLGRLGGEDAIRPGFQLLQLGGFDALAVRLCG